MSIPPKIDRYRLSVVSLPTFVTFVLFVVAFSSLLFGRAQLMTNFVVASFFSSRLQRRAP